MLKNSQHIFTGQWRNDNNAVLDLYTWPSGRVTGRLIYFDDYLQGYIKSSVVGLAHAELISLIINTRHLSRFYLFSGQYSRSQGFEYILGAWDVNLDVLDETSGEPSTLDFCTSSFVRSDCEDLKHILFKLP